MTFGEWELLAKQGIAEAEYNLGPMFSRGKVIHLKNQKSPGESAFYLEGQNC